MRIVTQTSSDLVLEHRPVIFPVVLVMTWLSAAVATFRSPESLGPGEWVAAVAGHLVGGFIVYLTAQRSRVTFDGEKRMVTWQHIGWPGAENAIRPLVVGRKNWLFSQTPSGAQASAAIYSLIETAKANGLSPYEYLQFVFETLPTLSKDDLGTLLPWRWKDTLPA